MPSSKTKTTLALFAAINSASAFTTSPSVNSHKGVTTSSTGNNSGTTKTQLRESQSDLKVLAKELNPLVGYFDPLMLGESSFWGQSNEATIGFLRHAEIKHGRVAMAAFVGYVVQSSFVLPYPQSLSGAMAPGLDLSPEEQWDAVDANAKLQILFVIACLEFWDEMGGGTLDHYMKGRQPGKFPSFQKFRETVHFVPDLYDPLGFNKNMKQETKEKRLLAEINNGRLAMLGIFGFVTADKIPGSVPTLGGIARPYSGHVMNPFENELGNPWSFDSFDPSSATAAIAPVVDAAVTAAQ